MQKLKEIPISELKDKCRIAFGEFKMSHLNINAHLSRLYPLLKYAEGRGIIVYNRTIGEEYRKYVENETDYSASYRMHLLSTIHLVNLVVEGLPYEKRPNITEEFSLPNTKIGKLAEAFLSEIQEKGLKDVSMRQYRFCMRIFSYYAENNGIELKGMNNMLILEFIIKTEKSMKMNLTILRKFLSFLYNNKEISIDFSKALRYSQLPCQSRVISFYSPKEVRQIEMSVLRTNPIGKRNYAIVLLASRLGLRASDIAGLKYEHINWEKCTIRFCQYKTGNEIELPLLSEVGEAIIDYSLHGRPKIKSPWIFISAVHPFIEMRNNAVSGVIDSVIRNSQVNINGRHHAAHSLRHSLATTMMNQGSELHVISSALGHESTESTMCYIGVNLRNLLECSNQVPYVPDTFYRQKGGAFYD